MKGEVFVQNWFNGTFTDSIVVVIAVTNQAGLFDRTTKIVLIITNKKNSTDYRYFAIINMYVVTMAWRCISPWSFNRSLQRRREMDIFGYISRFPRILSKNNQKKRRKLQLNARKHWESKSRNRSLSAAVLHVKPSRHNSNLYYSRENHHKVEILNYSVSLQYRKRNRDFITINFQNLAFFRESFTCSNVVLALSLEIYFPWQ